MAPLVWFLTFCSNAILKIFGDRTNFTEARVSREELRDLVEDAAKSGSVHPETSEIAARALAFEDVRVAELMVPNGDAVALRRGAPLAEIKRVILEEGHSRMPVYEETLDHIIGYVVARDILALAWERELLVFDDILRPAYFVNHTVRAVDVLREMQRRRTQLALVTDEDGHLMGLVTIEDLIEELVGDILSEDDEAAPYAAWDAEGTSTVPGTALLRRLNRALETELPAAPGRTTVAGLCMLLAEGRPERGARYTAEDGTILEVVEASPRRVRTVKLHRARRDAA